MEISGRKLAFIVGGITLAVMAGTGASFYFWMMPSKNEKQYLAAQESVKSNLIDPNSAIFEKLTAGADEKVVCGYVNSKNKFGGYVGRKIFVVFKDSRVRFEPNTVDSKECRMPKVPFSTFDFAGDVEIALEAGRDFESCLNEKEKQLRSAATFYEIVKAQCPGFL